MLFLADFHVEYGATMSQRDLFTIWSGEAGDALAAKQAGVIVDLWKCVGERRVIVVFDVDSHDTLDEILFSLPIMVKMGQHVHIKVTALRRYEDFVGTVNKLLDAGKDDADS